MPDFVNSHADSCWPKWHKSCSTVMPSQLKNCHISVFVDTFPLKFFFFKILIGRYCVWGKSGEQRMIGLGLLCWLADVNSGSSGSAAEMIDGMFG